MPIDRKNKLAFIHVPRTGGQSICEALGLEVTDKHEPLSWYKKNYPGYYYFTVFRSFPDRIDSAKRKGDKSEDYRLQTKPFNYFIDEDIDRILLYDNLQAELNMMLINLNMKPVKLPHIC